MCWTVHPAAIADLITRLEDLAVLMWFERPIAADDEHRLDCPGTRASNLPIEVRRSFLRSVFLVPDRAAPVLEHSGAVGQPRKHTGQENRQSADALPELHHATQQ
jgi:hypothetical protein